MKIYPVFEPHFSFYSLVFSVLAHLGAIIAVLCVTLLWLVKIILVVIIVVSLIMFLRRHVYRNTPHAIVKLEPTNDNVWLLINKTQHSIKAVLRGNSVCSLHLVLLNFKVVDARKYFSVIILPDALSDENFRQLRIVVKGQRLKA